jgi:hypothetical protein
MTRNTLPPYSFCPEESYLSVRAEILESRCVVIVKRVTGWKFSKEGIEQSREEYLKLDRNYKDQFLLVGYKIKILKSRQEQFTPVLPLVPRTESAMQVCSGEMSCDAFGREAPRKYQH